VALKLAQFDVTSGTIIASNHIVVMNIFDKLDPGRVQQIIQLVDNDSFGQVIYLIPSRQRIRRTFRKSTINHRVFELVVGMWILSISTSN